MTPSPACNFPIATARWKSNELGGNYAETAISLGAYGERPALHEIISKEEDIIPTYGR